MQQRAETQHPFRLKNEPAFALPAGFFPPGVVWAVGYEHEQHPPLLPEEAACQAKMGPARRKEFALGRALARVVLKELGISHYPLLVDSASGAPLWPKGIVGAISHTKGFALVAIAPASLVSGLGVDVEVLGRLRAALWSRILTSVDLDWLKAQPLALHENMATLIFSAKESFYKYQYPITGRWLGLLDISMKVDLASGGLASNPPVEGLFSPSGRFYLTPTHACTAFWSIVGQS